LRRRVLRQCLQLAPGARPPLGVGGAQQEGAYPALSRLRAAGSMALTRAPGCRRVAPVCRMVRSLSPLHDAMEKLVVALLVCPCHAHVTLAVPPVPFDSTVA
jgi:hypothetical protein